MAINKTCLVTGAAGFIGSHLTRRLLENGCRVIGVDCFTDYYEPQIKERNVSRLLEYPSFELIRKDLVDIDHGWFEKVEWVFHQAANQVARWRRNHHADFQISINKSPVQFHHNSASLMAWAEYLRGLGLPGCCIVVEITEGLLLDASPLVSEKLFAFRDAGTQVALDDFGTGYSSLAYLKKFDIDYLKIDQTFVRNLAANSTDMALCEAMILMAHKLGMQVIAEGIETPEQHDLLLQAGCDHGQGYLFSRAVPAEEFEKLYLSAV